MADMGRPFFRYGHLRGKKRWAGGRALLSPSATGSSGPTLTAGQCLWLQQAGKAAG